MAFFCVGDRAYSGSRAPFLIICFLFVTFCAQCQVIDNLASFRMMDVDRYIRIHVDNDYFTATDDYYTGGNSVEMVHPIFSKNPLNRLLINLGNGKKQYGIAIEQNGYTPRSIEHSEILFGDRPFAGTLMIKSFSINNDPVHHRRIVSALSLGVIGPASGAFEVQKGIHKLIHYTIPQGWQNQISQDVIINYEVRFEKNLIHNKRNNMLLNGLAEGRAGTLNTKLSTGFVFMFGKLNPGITGVFSESTVSYTRHPRFHAYFQPMVNVVGYDATLQGGVFNHDSPYTFSYDEVSHFTFQAAYGVVLTFRSIYLEYFKEYITKEFKSGDQHRWGGIRIGVKLQKMRDQGS